MRKYIVLVLAAAIILTGCDALRKLAGRPTAAQVEQMRLDLVAEHEAILQAQQDSIRMAEQAAADSLALTQSDQAPVEKAEEPVVQAPAKKFSHSYAIVIGAFQEKENAEKLADLARSKGYPAEIASIVRGRYTVCVCPTDSRDEAAKSLDKLLREDFCPGDAWIYVRK